MASTNVLLPKNQKQVNGQADISELPRIQLQDEFMTNPNSYSPSQPLLSIAVDPIALVTTECITVTSAMRKHARWAQSSVTAILGGSSYRQNSVHPATNRMPGLLRKDPTKRSASAGLQGTSDEDGLTSRWGLRGKKGKSLQDNPLMAAFTQLRSDIRECKGEQRNR